MKSVSIHYAKVQAEAEMGKPIRALGFEQREVGPHIVNIFFYECDFQYDDISGTHYRADVYCDGKRTNGLAF